MTGRRLLLAFVVLGLLASGYATYVHYRLIQDPSYISACDVSATISCTQAYMSRFGSMGGVPVALLGLLWFVLVALLVWVAGTDPGFTENVLGYVFVLATIALSFVLYLGYAAFFILKVACPLCLLTYAAVIGIFVISGAQASFPMATLPGRFFADVRRSGRRAIVTAILFFGAAAAAVAFFPREAALSAAAAPSTPAADQDQRSEFERWYTAQVRVPLVVPAEGAKVLIVDFSDFQCPYCRQAYYTLKPLLAKYNAQQPGSVRLVLKDYPLDSECNPYVQNGGPHPSACEAAVAVRLARTHNRGDAMEEWLFSNQPSLTPQLVKQAARDVGQVNDFDAKYGSTIDLVKGDIAFGKTLDVSATPTLFINGVKIAGVLAPQYFDQAIAYELQHAAAK
jgi:uncharacterized membrane protein/protein-disulfide isomerase